MKQLLAFLRQPRNLAALSAAMILVGYMVFLIMANYTSQMDLQRSAASRFEGEERNLARILSRFFSEKEKEVADLAGSRTIAIYFENKALGMTMAYGLRASIISIENRFKAFMGEERLGNASVYKGLILQDQSGHPIAAAGETEEIVMILAHWNDRPDSGGEGPRILVKPGDPLQYAVIATPCRFKGAQVGETAALVDMEAVRRHFLTSEDPAVRRRLVLDLENAGNSSPSEPVRAANAVSTPLLSYRIPVQGTPFDLVTRVPASRIYGETRPDRLLLATAALGLLILGTAVYFVGMNARNRILQAHLKEATAREAEIEEKNLALDRYRLNLEQMVEERTLELKKTQKELLIKATEAGRAQMATVVLHNIGNAVTPAMVHVEQMKIDGLEKIVFYLNRCYEDLKAHTEDLGAYITRDPRGKEVAAYAETLIRELGTYQTDRLRVIEEVHAALSYVAETLTLQQSYGPETTRMRETADLNQLVEDALLIQAGTLQQGNIHVNKVPAPGPLLVRVERNRLMQTLINLIRNSCEAMDFPDGSSPERRLQIKTFKEHDQVGFEVTDTGIGLETDSEEDLFEFGNSRKGSSGFGLTYCKEFVEANQGSISLTSPGPNKGATARVTFPDPS